MQSDVSLSGCGGGGLVVLFRCSVLLCFRCLGGAHTQQHTGRSAARARRARALSKTTREGGQEERGAAPKRWGGSDEKG